MRRIPLICIMGLTVFLCGCGRYALNSSKDSEGVTTGDTSRVIQPNGDSELALLMRHMADELESKRERLMQGQGTAIQEDYRPILTAHPTSPRMKGEYYEDLAKATLRGIEHFNRHRDVSTYNQLIYTCIACHQQACPGPLGRINKLLIYL